MFFDLFKRKKDTNAQEIIIYAPASGKVAELRAANDGVFSEENLGKGCMIYFDGKFIFSPADGKVTHIAPSKHAFCVLSEEGAEILVHVGLDTVNLNGQGFSALATECEYVSKGEPILKVKRDVVFPDDATPIVFVTVTNSCDFQDVTIVPTNLAEQGMQLLHVKK